MTPLEATNFLRMLVREDRDVKIAVMGIVERGGFADLFDWAEREPDAVVLLAESLVDTSDQFAEFARRLSTGDLS